MTDTNSGLSYKDAGVDIDAGEALVDKIKSVTRKTRRAEVLTDIGGFGALFALPKGLKEPVMVAGTDGVGTKLRLAIDLNKHHTVGIDLVAMCVNDLIVQGAEPLFFLDYYATGKLDVEVATAVVTGIGEGCIQSGCSLIGGETAEMPGMYHGSDFDLAGFCVGIVDRENIIDGTKVNKDDVLIGIASSGRHSNGFSLIRKVIEVSKTDTNELLQGKSIGEHLLEPTRIYVKQLLNLLKHIPIHAMAHITGGGLLDNIPRVLPKNTKAVIDTTSWQWPAIFNWLQQQGNIKTREMYRTFNCGVGMVLVVPRKFKQDAVSILASSGEDAWVIGNIETTDEEKPVVDIAGI